MKKYQIIYADPPWRYTPAVKNRRVENHYPTMHIKDILSMKISAEKNSVLFLWATASKLPECLSVMGAWGFKYKSQLSWDKKIIGMGYWFRGQHELLLVGTRGRFHPPTPENRISSVWSERRTIHSKKPDGIRMWISRCYPGFTKIELFARQRVDGWDAWGNEIEESPVLGEESPAQNTMEGLTK